MDFAYGYAEDYFRSQTCAKPSMAFADLAASTNSESVTSDLTVSETVTEPRETEPRGNVYESWLKTLQFGFSLLVSGVGSKRNLLQKFSDEVLVTWGASVVVIEGSSSRLLAGCEQVLVG